MNKPLFDDITPPEREAPAGSGSIRDVEPLTTEERVTRRARRAERRQMPSAVENSGNRAGANTRLVLWGAAIVVLLLVLAGVAFVFIGKTTITVVPLEERITLSDNVVHTAYQEPEAGELGYTVVNHTMEKGVSVPASGREHVEERAVGRIVVYNNYSEASQRLIVNTRFEAQNGDIYRVRDSFVVPGQKTEGARTVPGRIEVTVYADAPGEQFNITDMSTRFTIPGLKGDPRFEAFHAEMATPITGGFVGERATVAEGVLASTRAQLRGQLQSEMLAAVRERAPENSELFADSLFVTFESLPPEYSDGENANVRERAIIQALTFNRYDFGRAVAKAALATPAEGNIFINNIDSLTFSIVNKDEVDVQNDAHVQFKLDGSALLTWEVDTESLKNDLVGKHSGALTTVMGGYPGIESARATIRPFWKSEFPSEAGNIEVEVTTEE
ncbi:MAG: hypothetical protein Q8P16_01520 [bacterium]|nr:hypothetical protein [bacterium]